MDLVVVGQTAMLVLGAAEVLAIVAAAWPARPREGRVDRARRRAQWVTVAAVVPVVWLGGALALALDAGDGRRDRGGALLVLVLGGVVALGIVVTRAAWRAAGQARRHEEGRAIGLSRIVDEDLPSGPHEGLSGRTPPPQRW